MIKQPELKLYSTEGCHLCEQAFEMLRVLGVIPEVIDIAYNDALYQRYGVTIPVLHFADSEINWPFSNEQLKFWLKENGITYHT